MKNFKALFDKIDNLRNFKLKNTDRPVIDIEMCRLYYSVHEAAKDLGTTIQAIYRAINLAQRVKGCRLEFYEEWKDWDSLAKEKYSRRFKIYFL